MTKQVTWAIALTLATLFVATCGGVSEAEKHFDAGLELHGQGFLEDAIAQYDETIKLDPQFASP